MSFLKIVFASLLLAGVVYAQTDGEINLAKFAKRMLRCGDECGRGVNDCSLSCLKVKYPDYISTLTDKDKCNMDSSCFQKAYPITTGAVGACLGAKSFKPCMKEKQEAKNSPN